MSKILIVYATKMGMSKLSSETIAEILRKESNFILDIVDLNEKKVKEKELKKYDYIIIGSGIRMGKWYKAAKKFLRNDFKGKKVFVFICSMGAQGALLKNNSSLYEMKLKEYLDEVINKSLNVIPISKAVFGGKKKSKGEIERKNWKKEEVIKWANEINQILKSE